METESSASDTARPQVAGGVSERLAQEVVNKDQTVAAYFLIVFASLNFAAAYLSGSREIEAYVAPSIDLLIGACIAMGLYFFLFWLKVRLVLGAIFAVMIATFGGQPVAGVFTIVYAAGLSLLVFGKPSKLRRIAAYILLGAIILMTLLGLVAIFAGVE